MKIKRSLARIAVESPERREAIADRREDLERIAGNPVGYWKKAIGFKKKLE